MTSVLITFSLSLSQCPRFLSMILRGQQKKKKNVSPNTLNFNKIAKGVQLCHSAKTLRSETSRHHQHPHTQRFPFCFISIHHVSLFFWPETVAPPEVQLVLALISCVWHAQTAWVSVYTARSTLYITHTGSRNILNCFRHREEQDISVTGTALFSNNNQFI